MKLQFSPKIFPFLQQNHQHSSGVFASLFSAKTRFPSSSLEQWVFEGRTVDKRQLQYLVRTMKDIKRFQHPPEISQWMSDRRYLSLSCSDIALRLDLIHRVHGTEQAENYFNNVSSYLKTYNVYGALLSGYVREKSVEIAEATVQKMRELGLATSSFPCMLIKLYNETGDFDKIGTIIQEMDQKRIPQDKYTIKNQMAAYIAASDISGMERVLNFVEKDTRIFVDWKVYSVMANGYLKLGSIEKALAMLKKMEGMMPHESTNLAFEVLITLYASNGKKDELYRVWNTCKPSDEIYITDGLGLVLKLDYLEGQGDVSEMENIIGLLKKLGPLNRGDIYHRWLRTCTEAGGSVSEVLDQMKMDGFPADEETQNILQTRPNL